MSRRFYTSEVFKRSTPSPFPPCCPTVTTPPLWSHFYDPYEVPDYVQIPRPPEANRNVFDRLTDITFYTGAHRERFDEYGNGRGLAGREYLCIHDGLTESPSRTHEVYSSVIRKPQRPVVTPGTVGVQKYGVQVNAPRLMWLFRNGDKHYNGVAFFLRNHVKTMECLYTECTKAVSPIIGPVRRIYNQSLRPVKRLEDIVDGGKYLCCSGKPRRRTAVTFVSNNDAVPAGEPPAPLDRLEKFLSGWVVQKPHTQQRSDFFIV